MTNKEAPEETVNEIDPDDEFSDYYEIQPDNEFEEITEDEK